VWLISWNRNCLQANKCEENTEDCKSSPKVCLGIHRRRLLVADMNIAAINQLINLIAIPVATPPSPNRSRQDALTAPGLKVRIQDTKAPSEFSNSYESVRRKVHLR